MGFEATLRDTASGFNTARASGVLGVPLTQALFLPSHFTLQPRLRCDLANNIFLQFDPLF